MSGDCSYDKYEHDYIVYPYDVLIVERKKREDTAPVKRVAVSYTHLNLVIAAITLIAVHEIYSALGFETKDWLMYAVLVPYTLLVMTSNYQVMRRLVMPMSFLLVKMCIRDRGMRVRIEHKANEGQSRAASVFQRLVSAGKRLRRVIEHNEGGANKDLAKFADQINALCDKWDR